jgi:hypothetical protein
MWTYRKAGSTPISLDHGDGGAVDRVALAFKFRLLFEKENG